MFENFDTLKDNPRSIYTDSFWMFFTKKNCEELHWNHETSTPHRSEINGIAERDVRRVKEGTSSVLIQSGLHKSWWAEAMECCCYLRNVQVLLADGHTPHERRFNSLFEGLKG